MRVTLDSNILIYAFDSTEPARQRIAIDITARATRGDMILTAQVLGEFLSVIRRKLPDHLVDATDHVRRLSTLVPCALTMPEHLIAAAAMVQHHRFQFWDAVIWQVAASRGVQWFVTEDMQDGFSLGGLTMIDPFDTANRGKLAAIGLA